MLLNMVLFHLAPFEHSMIGGVLTFKEGFRSTSAARPDGANAEQPLQAETPWQVAFVPDRVGSNWIGEDGMNGGKEKVVGVIGPALACLAVLLAAASAINLAQLAAISTPHVGDIIAFDTPYPTPLTVDARLLVHRPDRFACVLDLDVIRQNGGSVIVEARVPGESRAYYLHWAGMRTSADTSDCGHAADLIVDHHDLDLLALGAGGYGTGYKPVQVSAYSQGY